MCAPARGVFDTVSGVNGIDGIVNLVDSIHQCVVIDL